MEVLKESMRTGEEIFFYAMRRLRKGGEGWGTKVGNILPFIKEGWGDTGNGSWRVLLYIVYVNNTSGTSRMS